MNETFYATVKLLSGEEVLCQAIHVEEEGQELYLLSDPIVIDESSRLDPERGVAMSGMSPRMWMMYSNDDLVAVRKDHVITISEMDKFGKSFYEKALLIAKVSTPVKKRVDQSEHLGYLGEVDERRAYLERIFNLPLQSDES
mgnify:CR=1 FL=1